ncbi:MAG TPA: protein translocase subunit SecF [Methylomirabilota bacterium]
MFRNTTYDFIRWRWHAIALSLVVVLGGVGLMVARGGLPLGIDFSGGTLVVLRFAEAVSEDDVRAALESLEGEKVVQQYGEPEDNEIMIRLPQVAGTEQGFALEEGAASALEAVRQADLPEFEVLSTEVVGPVIGADLQRKGIYATLASIVGITIYIAVRFRFSFAAGAIAATFHDVAVVLAFLSFFGYELSLNVVAAILTITGYSVNDTIVIFDRVRENSRLLRRDPLEKVVNLSVNQTLSRTVITAGTTFFAVLALYLFGGEVLHGFAFAMLVGIVSGTYSTVFIAAAIAIILSGRKAPAGRAAVPVEEAVAERPRKRGRNVRVS